MEWVETTGHSVKEAKKYALEQLGVAESDAEFEVLAEPKTGLFGRLKEEARVRARVRPRYPRAKSERRGRRRAGAASAQSPEEAQLGPSTASPADNDGHPGTPAGADQPGSQPQQSPPASRDRRRRTASQPKPSSGDSVAPATLPAEQVQKAEEFLRGLFAEAGTVATVAARQVADQSVELSIEGQDLGAFIGPRGATLLALQELTRVVSQGRAREPGSRLFLDINGYRKRRNEALARFVKKIAAEVRATNSPHALEPMNAADRKLVHDTVNLIPGVVTMSEGEDPHRRVVIMPSEAEGEPSHVAQ
ncbi:MAG: RNA-binding cell elongation regulator Jag/EloR [Acidimicrobiales bacterium]